MEKHFVFGICAIFFNLLALVHADVTRTASASWQLYSNLSTRSIENLSLRSSSARARVLPQSRIYFAGDPNVRVYVNGIFRKYVRHRRHLAVLTLFLKPGDVIAAEVIGTYGKKNAFIADISLAKRHLVTGRGGWAAINVHRNRRYHPRGWTSKKFDACRWPGVVSSAVPQSYHVPRRHRLWRQPHPKLRPRQRPHTRSIPRGFPKRGARYVMTRQWPKHQLYTTTLFRYVIGGELCANIDFAADNRAIMYVNGRYVGAVLHRAHVRRIRLKLSIGDTIAVRAQSFGGGFGFIAHISLPRGRYIVTGHPGWKVMKGNWRDSRNPRGWMTTGFKQGCSWKHATRVRKRFSPAIPRTFPISNGPKYIWVGNSGSRAVTLIRYVVGGERCSKIPPNSFPAKITVAADNLAWLYINGIFVRKVRDWRKFQTLPTRLKDGDVIGLRVKNLGHWYGAIANVEYKGHNFGTGHPDWKAINVRHYSGKGKLGWAKRGYNSCQWYPAVKLPKPNSIHPGKAPGFPYKTGALYVWGRGAGARDIVLLRYVVGGEACRRKISFTADDRASLYINGHLRARSLQWWRAKKVITPLRTGDVVTVVAENRRGAHGVKAAITQPGLVMVTGSLGWKAIKIASSFHGVELWKKRKYRACGWPAPIVVGHSSHYRSRRVHGLPRNSKWVWASRAGKTGKVILRYVIGGEYCPKRKVPNAVITFAARSKVTLLINGKIIASTNGFRAKVVRAELGTGDAVSFVVSNRRVGIAGGIADIFFWKTGKHFPTGRHGWKATRAFAGFGTKWDSRKFRSCSWLPAKPISRFVKLPLFKVPAKLVWADKVKYSGPIFLRYVVGGEQCAPSPPPPNPKSGVVTLTADNGAIVFINGKPFGHVRSWREVLRLPIQFEDGDVIGIAAHDSGFWFGVKAIVSIGKKFPTGASGWKAKAGLGKKELQKFRWARGDFSSCKWKEPAVRPDPHRKFRSIAPRFPHVVGLQNVWAQHARVGQVAFFRFVVGGEKC